MQRDVMKRMQIAIHSDVALAAVATAVEPMPFPGPVAGGRSEEEGECCVMNVIFGGEGRSAGRVFVVSSSELDIGI